MSSNRRTAAMLPPMSPSARCRFGKEYFLSDPGTPIFVAIRALSSFLFIASLIFGYNAVDRHPILLLGLSLLMIPAGLASLIYSLVQLKRLHPIYDYMPIVLWGRTMNGKKIREILTTINVIGLWILLMVLIFTLISAIHLISSS
jgi:hypothetical protein